MTTRAITVSHDAADQWPLFRGVDPKGVHVLAVVARRRAYEPIATVSAEITDVVGGVLRQMEGLTLCLLLLKHEYPTINKLQALTMERHKLWESLEMQGVTLPAGERAERDISERAGHTRFFGSIYFEAPALEAALELTRSYNAVCVVSPADAATEKWDDQVLARALEQEAQSRDDRGSLVKGAVGGLPRGGIVLWSFGAFDDVEISVNVAAEAARADELDGALRVVLSREESHHPRPGDEL